MFMDNISLTNADLSGLPLDNGSVSGMFRGDEKITGITLGEKCSLLGVNAELHNGGWANIKEPEICVSGSDAYAVIPNNGKNTYELTAKVVEAVKGDSNSDGNIDTSDLVSLGNWLHGKADAELKSGVNSDLNSDGKIDVFDMIELRKLIIKNSK